MQNKERGITKAGVWVTAGAILAGANVMASAPQESQANSLPGREKPNIVLVLIWSETGNSYWH